MELREVLRKFGLDGGALAPFISAEDGGEYAVWRVERGEKRFVLKRAKGDELQIYTEFFREPDPGVARLYGSLSADGETYILMEYIEGEDLRRCDRRKLTAALDALIGIQRRHWDREDEAFLARKLAGRRERGRWLGDPALMRAYGEFLALFETLPRTLCHDDLLPINVLYDGERAVLIDWEHAGPLPWPTSFARLIAHGGEEGDDFFFMKEEDREFAVGYYYEHFAKALGIGPAEYRRAVDLFLLYEYCEWIMLGNRYEDADMVRYERYLERARAHVRERGL